MTLRLPRLDAATSYFDATGRPSFQMQLFWQKTVEAIEKAFADVRLVNEQQSDMIAALQAAQDAIAAAEQAVETVNAAVIIAQEAAAEAAATAETAQEAVNSANAVIEDIEAGTLNLAAVKIGGTRFVSNNGELVAEV